MATKRVCIQSGCGTLIEAGLSRCVEHERDRDKARGTRQERGYDAEHDAARRKWLDLIDNGSLVYCARGCGARFRPGDMFHLDHTDDRQGYRGPSCERCNTSAGAKASHQQRARH